MSEIVFVHTDTSIPRPGPDDFHGNRRVPADRKITIFQSHNKVALVSSVLVCGLAKRGLDKMYYQWRSIGSAGFRRNSAGTVIPYEANRPWDFHVGTPWKHRIPTAPFAYLDGMSTGWNQTTVAEEGYAAFKQAVWSTFGIRTMHDLYPMAQEYGLISYRSIPYGLRMAMRSEDWEGYSAKAFGKKRTTPRLISAVRQTEPYIVAIAQQFRGYVPDELIVKYMENNHFDDEMEEGFEPHSPFLRKILPELTEKTRINILESDLDLSEMRRFQSLVVGIRHNIQRIDTTKDYATLSELVPWVR